MVMLALFATLLKAEVAKETTCADVSDANVGASLLQFQSTSAKLQERHPQSEVFNRLESAVRNGDMKTFGVISEELRMMTLHNSQYRRGKDRDDSNPSTPHSLAQHASETSARRTGRVGECLFDDRIFKLTNEAKLELGQELDGETVSQVLQELQSTDQDFHLKKILKSTSYLQEAWVFLLRFLGQSKLLPAGTGDRLYHGVENWSARGGYPMTRHWLKTYIKTIVTEHATGPRCMEWDSSAYTPLVPQCTEPVFLKFEDDVYHDKQPAWWEGHTLHSDIEHAPSMLQGKSQLNLILALQVFEHLKHPYESASKLFQGLVPGGALVFTVPQLSQYHPTPSDYFRFTKIGAVSVLQNAGFCVPKWSVAGGGDFIYDIGRDAGLTTEDFPEVDTGMQFGFDQVSHSAINIYITAFKPPHTACDDQIPPLP
jgi:hypothetical protein